ncbi:MAG: uncharacterized protein PWR13_601 [Archaeoglobi archaeon]|nr:uncharacterized protein [Archaeoglobi archaeon]
MEQKILGIDIFSHSPSSKKSPRYSLYLFPEGRIYEGVSRRKMIRLVSQLSPKIIAVDNIYELAPDRERLLNLVRKFHPSELVQVTSQGESLVSLARRYGIQFNRNNPADEAKVCAILASMGVGQRVLLFEDKTRIEVRRCRRPGRGGWSENRFRRKIHGNVKRTAESIEELLKRCGFSYEKEVREGYGGYVSCVFLVDAPPERVPVSKSSFEAEDVRIKISQVERSSIEFQPLSDSREYLIVGIDPGTTTAVAALNLRGELVAIHSSREMSFSEMLNFISSLGKPVVIASDVTPAPNTLRKVKSSFNAILHEPKESLSVQLKNELSRGYSYSNAHERDAIAAAVNAFRFYKNKFEQIEKRAPPGISVEEVKAMVLRGAKLSEILGGDEEERVEEGHRQTDEGLRRSYHSLLSKYRKMEERIQLLERMLEERDETIRRLEDELQRVREEEYRRVKTEKEIILKEREISRLRNEIRGLRKALEERESEIEELKKIISLKFSDSFIPVKVISSFTKEEIQRIERSYGIRSGEIIYIQSSGGGGRNSAAMLADSGIHAVIVEGEISHQAREVFEERKIPVLKGIRVHVFGDFGLMNREEFERAFEKWKEEEEKRKERKILEIIEEYKKSRMG